MTSIAPAGFSRPIQIDRWKDGLWTSVEDVIAEELFIRVFVDQKIYGSLVCSPWALDELVVGYLYTDGVIESYGDIAALETEADAVYVTLRPDAAQTPAPAESPAPCRLTADAVTRLVGDLETNSQLFHHTGGVHTAALSDGADILARCEDVGRHNALDRLIGRCLIRGIPLAGRAIVFSGRVPDEILRKVVRVGCSAILSVSAPTSLAVETAQAEGILLIGFVRGNRFNVYTHPERLIR